MTKVRPLILYIGILSFLFFVSCQKEVSYEIGKAARGSLQSSSGECLPKVVGGTYKAGSALGDTNFIDVTIDVAQGGSYNVYTDTVNGYSFKASGNTSTTGANVIHLKGVGTPINAGVNNVTVHFDTTVCSVPITVLPGSGGGGGGGGTAAFTLAGSPGNCLNSAVAGTYTQGTALTNANKVTVQVNVTALGTWSMTTNSVTGFSFSNNGTFTTLGVQNVTLNATGTPNTAGSQTFSVSAGTASCTFNVTVAQNTTPPATFTLSGAPGACMNSIVAGTYAQGSPLTNTNSVAISVNVTAAGQWNITTNSVTGMTFTGSGTFASTGAQIVTLNGAGTPTTAGSQTFTVTAGTSTCTFSVTVTGTTPPPSNDHFILTPNSWWSYDDGSSPPDTLKRLNSAALPLGSPPFTYRQFDETDQSGNSTPYFYRKDAVTNFYYEYTYVDDYSLVPFDNYVEGQILFLKENLNTGDTWNSAEWADSVSGVPTKLRYKFDVLNSNATETLNGVQYTNVYKITMKPQTAPGGSSSFTDEGLVWEFHYAKSIGMILIKGSYMSTTVSFPIRHYQVF